MRQPCVVRALGVIRVKDSSCAEGCVEEDGAVGGGLSGESGEGITVRELVDALFLLWL